MIKKKKKNDREEEKLIEKSDKHRKMYTLNEWFDKRWKKVCESDD